MGVPKGFNELFYQLLRLSLGLAQELPDVVSADEWRRLYQMAVRQSLVGVCYQGVRQLKDNHQLPLEIAMQWTCEAETIKGLNELLYQEAARLTREFSEKGRQTAILKGQANARLYPDKYARQPGDIDIWVAGGRKSVLALISGQKASMAYHHAHLPKNENGVEVEIHFRPASGHHNPITNRRLQQWLEQEIQHTELVPEGFCVPTIPFALVMQLAHIQRHFLEGGVGLRQVCDYYWLLHNATDAERQQVADLLRRLGLHYAAGALMWVLAQVLHLPEQLMLCQPDSFRGEWMLREMMAGGNFGRYAKSQQLGIWRRFVQSKRRRLQLMRFNAPEMLWQELFYWKRIVCTLHTRIKVRSLSLRDYPECV